MPSGNLMTRSFSTWKYFCLMKNKVYGLLRRDPMTQEKNRQE